MWKLNIDIWYVYRGMTRYNNSEPLFMRDPFNFVIKWKYIRPIFYSLQFWITNFRYIRAFIKKSSVLDCKLTNWGWDGRKKKYGPFINISPNLLRTHLKSQDLIRAYVMYRCVYMCQCYVMEFSENCNILHLTLFWCW